MWMPLLCGDFLVNVTAVRVPAQGNLNIKSSSARRSSNILFPREQANKQTCCGRGRNMELAEAGS